MEGIQGGWAAEESRRCFMQGSSGYVHEVKFKLWQDNEEMLSVQSSEVLRGFFLLYHGLEVEGRRQKQEKGNPGK